MVLQDMTMSQISALDKETYAFDWSTFTLSTT